MRKIKSLISGLIIFTFGFPVLMRLLLIPSVLNLAGIKQGYSGDGFHMMAFFMIAVPIFSLSIALAINLFYIANSADKVPLISFLGYYFSLALLFLFISLTIPA